MESWTVEVETGELVCSVTGGQILCTDTNLQLNLLVYLPQTKV